MNEGVKILKVFFITSYVTVIPRFIFYYRKGREIERMGREQVESITSMTTSSVTVLFFDDVSVKNDPEEIYFLRLISPAPTLQVRGRPRAWYVTSRWCGYSAGCRRLTSRSEQKKKFKCKNLRLLFAFLPNLTNHFKYFNRKLESTVFSVMSHVGPANFQALDQRVS